VSNIGEEMKTFPVGVEDRTAPAEGVRLCKKDLRTDDLPRL
jgi:hypothetical protein